MAANLRPDYVKSLRTRSHLKCGQERSAAQFGLKRRPLATPALAWPWFCRSGSPVTDAAAAFPDIGQMISRLDVAIVIAVLCAGAVVAVPRHAGIATEARLAQVTALARSATTAAELGHSRWLAENRPPTIDGTRGVVAMTYGYPSAATLPLMLGDAETATFTYADGLWRHASLGASKSCGVAYQPPATAGQNPSISPQTSGC